MASEPRNLERYEKKRDFRRSPEPPVRLTGAGSRSRGSTAPAPSTEAGLQFVVQKHRASRLHYDFRLELDGVLKSWAVPKGPSADPADRRLAVMVEDHPLDYAGFEGTIPAGEYGAGEVIVWDRGLYAPEVDAERVTDRRTAEEVVRQGLAKGKLSFVLDGAKLRGSWALVRTRRSGTDGRDESEGAEEWLLLKHQDAAAHPGGDLLVADRSVLSGRTIEDVRLGLPAPSERPAPVSAWPTISPEPMLATLADKPFSRSGWLFEPKLDGIRVIAFAGGGRVELHSRRGHNVSRQFPGLAEQLARDYLQPVVLDGEIVALDESGAPSFERLQQRLNLSNAQAIAHAERDVPILYYVFDLLWAEGRDLRALPLTDRHDKLKRHLLAGPIVRPVASFPKMGEQAYDAAVDLGYEGVVAKRADSRYESGRRSPAWLKVKSTRSDDFVIGGYTRGLGRRSQSFGALLLGQYGDGGMLHYAGRVGTGFDEQMLQDLLRRLDRLRQEDCPFSEPPQRSGARWGTSGNETVVWTRPELVAEVLFMQRTRDGLLRAPAFLRLRPDKPAGDARPAEVADSAPSAKPEKPRSEVEDLIRSLHGAGEKLHVEVDGHEIALSNLGKTLWPATPHHPAVTKRDLLTYLLRVSRWLLPHVAGRPITLTRYPNGITGKTFYQRHWEHSRPPFLETVKVYSGHATADVEYLLCSNLATLVWLGQVADLEIHTWFSRVDPWPDGEHLPTEFRGSAEEVDRSLLNYPDFVAFDLDPYTYSGREEPGAEPELNPKAFAQVCRVAKVLKSMLDSLGLAAFLKTSGKTGLHVYVPILRRFTFNETRAACETIGRFLTKAHPRDVTMAWATGQRTGRVFFDYNMNARSKTVASVYSPRAVGGAGVSTPLRWEELDSIWPLDFTIHTVPERVARIGDLWQDILTAKHDLEALIRTTEAHPTPP